MLRSVVLLLCLAVNLAFAQEKPSDTQSREKAQALIQASIKALGGQAYLNVKTERSNGYITFYKPSDPDNKITVPDVTQTFIDYISLPDKERVELKGQGRRFIQTNLGNRGWTYDSESQLLRDQSDEQSQRFIRALRYQLDQILRNGWSTAGTELVYLPRQEVLPRQYAEGVRITFADGEEVKLFFDPQTNLPIALRFPKQNDKGERIEGENRFFRYVEAGGIKVPYIVDLFEKGAQVLRLNYDTRDFNVALPDKLFIKPDNAKSLK
ncbi:MAG: hypothetical protein AB1489_22235 [Acidobacteriota bacterium]